MIFFDLVFTYMIYIYILHSFDNQTMCPIQYNCCTFINFLQSIWACWQIYWCDGPWCQNWRLLPSWPFTWRFKI